MHTSYLGTPKSILISCITVWYSSCTVSCQKTLQRIVRAAERIIGAPSPPSRTSTAHAWPTTTHGGNFTAAMAAVATVKFPPCVQVQIRFVKEFRVCKVEWLLLFGLCMVVVLGVVRVGGQCPKFMGTEGRDGGGGSWKGVQLPDGLMDEAVSQSASSGPEAPHSPPGGQEVEQAVGGMGGVIHNAE